MLTLLLTVAAALLFSEYLIEHYLAKDHFLHNIPVRTLADACLVAFLVGGTFEWKVRQEAEDRLLAVLSELLSQQNEQLRVEIREDLNAGHARIHAALSSPMEGVPIQTEDEFFEKLQAQIIAAKRRVDLTYFDSRPPQQVRSARGIQYIKAMESIVREKRTVTFRRILRVTEAMLPRIEELMKTESGSYNSSVACYMDHEPHRESIEAVTIQLIDDDSTFFVSIGTQKHGLGAPRDMLIKSEAFADMWSRYYEQMWNVCTVVVDRGVPQSEAWTKVKKAAIGKSIKTQRTQRRSPDGNDQASQRDATIT